MDDVQPIRVAILDDYQDVASALFSPLKPRIELESFPDTLDASDPDQRAALIERLKGFEVISTMRERTAFPIEVISALPRLKLILTTGMVNASIATKFCAERGVLVVGTAGTRISVQSKSTKSLSPSLQATVEQTFALILAVTKLIPHNSSSIASGGWQTGLSTGLSGKTLGLVGLGRIGTMIARIAVLGFGMRVLAWSSNLTQAQADEKAAQMGLDQSTVASEDAPIVVAQSKADLFRAADIISLHYVLSPRSRELVSKTELALMKPTSVLINTSRGGLIDDSALLEALSQGRIHGVGLDVFATEPLPVDSPWRTTKWGENGAGHAVLSPHMGYSEANVVHGWYEESAEHLAEWLEGRKPATTFA